MRKSALPWILAALVIPPAAGAATVTDGTTQAVPPPAPQATPVGPLCVSALPFDDVLVLFLDPHGTTPNWSYFDTVGQELVTHRALSATLFVDAARTTLHVGYQAYPKVGFTPVIAGGTIDLATRTGPGQCYTPDLASCGDFTFQIIPCPTTALTKPGGRLQGQIR
jgi:hypothetical protein